MAEVEKVSTTATSLPEAAAAADIPLSETGDATGSNALEFGTSPTQEPSSNSHPHDSEYDTASDLEGGGEEYDDEEDDDDLDDESMTDGESMTDDDDDDDDEEDGRQGNISLEKAETEAQKKVDEDRSNPQYIPKRGTFYEHDDRTAEVDADRPINIDEVGESQDGGVGGSKPPQSPTISQASKTMKKWQAASGVERWSHDRFDASEQAPKSRSELVSSYGYDIRTEDAPPRARRRRRYGRGPSKYSRNWEDESAYLKASNKERKPPRASDFPSLNERSVHKTRKPQVTREEKENRADKRSSLEKPVSTPRPPPLQDERRDAKVSSSKGKNFSNQSNHGGRQAPMEFKQKQRNARPNNNSYKDSQSGRNDGHFERGNNRHQANSQQNSGMTDHNQQKPGNGKAQTHSRYSQAEGAYGTVVDNQAPISGGGNNHQSYQQQKQKTQLQSQQQSSSNSIRQQSQQKSSPTTSNLSQRLQQVQNRNDPSHVGSVQMHALASQNQLANQQQQLGGANVVLNNQQGSQQPQAIPQISQEQRGPPKRYSSLRRSQHEAQHITDQMQQMHIQQQQPPILMQDQHMMQANLMHLYHQENLQAMQAMQANQTPSQPPKSTSGYASVPAPAQGPPYANSGNTATPPAAFYVASPDVYTATATANPQAPPPGQYAQQAPPNYLPAASATTPTNIAYAGGQPTPTTPQVAGAPSATFGPTPSVPPATAAAAAGAATPNANANFSNYQNYNTVGGTTYFVPPAQATTRPVVLPQRRPTNAIPILPPSEKNKQRPVDAKDEAKAANTASQGNAQSTAPIGSAENIDHIIDNMFVQRPAFQPPQAPANPTRKSSSPSLNADNSGGDNSSSGGSVMANSSLSDDVNIAANGEKSSNNADIGQLEKPVNNAMILTKE
ncbi:protein CASC3 [Zeugodacus cucurbitae]|uniref:protein CASC3 n=1 Tax=Zeugodacus cucurbitae TaxID=28588 RepID=UPI0023D960D0|nr:protein CASC3 [Zeugodacus cucurbitae]XP_011181013.2 protein CASC3 [Zeugodacus cucurbitae]